MTAQMKAFFDRLFTWCHIFPLLGKYSLSVVTTGNDGIEETGEFLEKMLATYGTHSFGTISSMGGLNPGFFPWREKSREKYKNFAGIVAKTILDKKKPKSKAMQRKMFKTMHNKMSGIHAINCLVHGVPEGQPRPHWVRIKIMKFFINKFKLTPEQLKKWSEILSFELSWWRDAGWLKATSMKKLSKIQLPQNFKSKDRLLGTE